MSVDKKFEPIYELLKGSVIRGVVFSVYDKFGPQNIYSFPPAIEQTEDGFGQSREERIHEKIEKYKKIVNSDYSEGDDSDDNKKDSDTLIQEFTQRDLMQIAIKSLSFLIGEEIPDSELPYYYGVLPYPDFDVCAYTYFNYYSSDDSAEPKTCSFSLLIDNNRRRFIYDNVAFLKYIVKETADTLTSFLKNAEWTVEGIDNDSLTSIHSLMFDFMSKLKLAEDRPYTPITSKKQLKVALLGLKHSGKTSFLLTINRKYSELNKNEAVDTPDVHIADLMGATIVSWDVGETSDTKAKFYVKANVYLYDSNIVYYFIDATNTNVLNDSLTWFSRLIQYLNYADLKIPVVVIISQVDKDLMDNPEFRETIGEIRRRISAISLKYMQNFKFFETSIFDFASVLRAFSYGITILNPNKENADIMIQKYSKLLKSSAIMIFNENGLILGEYSINPGFDMKHEYPLKFILEALSPEYIELFKNLEMSNLALNKTKLIFKTKLDDGNTILLKKIKISDFSIFILLYTLENHLEDGTFNKILIDFTEEFTNLYNRFLF